MAPRFLVLIPRHLSSQNGEMPPLEDVEGLKRRCDQNAFTVWATADMPVQVLPQGGVIVGHVFPNGDKPLDLGNAPAASTRDIQRLLRSLLATVWGSYLAFFPLERPSVAVAMREPSGGLPCVHVETPAYLIIASDIDLLISAGFLTPEIDWSHLARHLVYPDLKSAGTCLRGVGELMPGHALVVGDVLGSQTPIWSTWDYCVTPPATFEDARRSVAAVVEACVSAWASRFGRVLLGVSGGLDSSIVAECLAPHTQLTLLTMHTGEAEGDERPYAQALADHLSLDLIAREHLLDWVDLRVPTSIHLPRPIAFGFGQSERESKQDLVAELGIDALFSGIGGDNVLCSLQSASPIVDRWRDSGVAGGWPETFGDVQRLTGASVWQVARAGLRRALKPGRYDWPPIATFLGPVAQRELSIPPSHPWLDAPGGAGPGKAAHIAMILRVLATNDGFARGSFPAQINPLISQPIIETCLRIPSWMWVAGGRDRAVARSAFADRLPATLIDRRTKGGPDSFAYRVAEANKRVLIDLLVDGRLAQQGLVDSVALEAVLPLDRPIPPSDHMRLATLAEAEVWARHWLDRQHKS